MQCTRTRVGGAGFPDVQLPAIRRARTQLAIESRMGWRSERATQVRFALRGAPNVGITPAENDAPIGRNALPPVKRSQAQRSSTPSIHVAIVPSSSSMTSASFRPERTSTWKE